MTAVEIRREEAIDEVFSTNAREVERLGWGEWRFLAGNGTARSWTARIEHGWLTAQTDLWDPGPEGFWEAASRESKPVSLVKLAVSRRGHYVLRGELSIDCEGDLVAQATEMLNDIDLLDHAPVRTGRLKTLAERDLKALSAGLCGSGWDVQEKDEDQLSVSLNGQAALNRAVVARLPGGRLAAQVRVLKVKDNDRHVRSAIGLLLLRASGCLRLVRGAVFNGDSAPAAGFLSILPQSIAAGDVAEALRALGFACELCGLELRALGNYPQLAVRYLELQGFHWHAQRAAAIT